MKKLLLSLFTAALLPTIYSCSSSDGDDTPAISKTFISLYADDTEQLKAGGSGKWATSDEYVAEVTDNGLVTAVHVGKAIISHGSDNCAVEVNPRYHTFVEPLCKKDATMSEVRAYENRQLFTDDATTLVYLDTDCVPSKKGFTSLMTYGFKDGKLSSAVFSIRDCTDNTVISELSKFLAERYQPVSRTDNLSFMFLDAYDKTKVKTLVGFYMIDPNNKHLTTVAYVPN